MPYEVLVLRLSALFAPLVQYGQQDDGVQGSSVPAEDLISGAAWVDAIRVVWVGASFVVGLDALHT